MDLSGAGYKGIDSNGKEVKAKDTLFQSNFQPDYSWLNKQLNQPLENQPAPAPAAPAAQRQVSGQQTAKTIAFDQIVEK